MKDKGGKEPKKPDPGPWHPGSLFQPGNLYNGMVSPVVPYGLRGGIWYQGESNSDRPYQYRALMAALIGDWRSRLERRGFPVSHGATSELSAAKSEPAESNWALIREAQSMTAAAVPNTAIAITHRHRRSQQHSSQEQAGSRPAPGRLRPGSGLQTPVKSSGPLFVRCRSIARKSHVSFTYAGARKAKEGDLTGFAIAGEDRHFVWADTRIEKHSFLVSSPKVAKPLAVRYAWADDPERNLMNGSDCRGPFPHR